MLFGNDKQEEESYLYRSQSTRKRFLFSAEFWGKALGLVGSALFDILLLSEPPAVVSILQAVPVPQPVILGVLVSSIFGFFTLISLVFERRTRNRHIAVQSALRDFSSLMAESIRNVRNRDIEKICQDCCDEAASVFAAELPKAGIGCAIRLADSREGGYVTMARSGRLSKARKNSSEPVGFDAVLASVLTNREAQNSSVVLCPNVPLAYDKGDLERDGNSNRVEFRDEVQSMMLARIVLTDGYGEGELAGIFYITSDKVGGLTDKEVDLMVTVSTMVSEVIREKLDNPELPIEDYEKLLSEVRRDADDTKSVRGEKVARTRKKARKGK